MRKLTSQNPIPRSLFQENAIEIGKREFEEIRGIGASIAANGVLPPNLTHLELQQYLIVRAFQEFLLRRGCRLQFRLNLEEIG